MFHCISHGSFRARTFNFSHRFGNGSRWRLHGFTALGGTRIDNSFYSDLFFATGILGIIAAFQLKPASRWGMDARQRRYHFVTGMMLWQQWPLSGAWAWAVGVLFGVQMISTGITLVGIGGAFSRVY